MKYAPWMLALLVMAGCTAPLPIVRPADPVAPSAYKTPIAETAVQVTEAWWTLFDDPQLNVLERQALASNPTLAIAAARVERARAQWAAGFSELAPRLSADGAAQRFRTSRDVATAPFIGGQRRAIEDNQFSTQATLGWEFDVWGRIQRSTEVAQAQLQSASLEADAMRLTLTTDVATAYLQLRGLDDEARILEAATQSRRDALRVVQLRYDVGVITELDLERARTELANAQADATDLARRRNGVENALAQLTGQAPSALRLPRAQPNKLQVPVIAVGIPSDMLLLVAV